MALKDSELRSQMEPAAEGLPVEMAVHVSVAISLRRIADFFGGLAAE